MLPLQIGGSTATGATKICCLFFHRPIRLMPLCPVVVEVMPSPVKLCPSADAFLRNSFDYVIIGGGTAGLAVAARLAENASLTIGVIEAGGIAADDDESVDIPAFYGRSLGGPLDWAFRTEPQEGLGGRSLPWPRGRVLGGTSALNFMTWVRGSQRDYDDWTALGNEGWSWNELL